MQGKIFLESTPLHEALSVWFGSMEKEGFLKPLESERIHVTSSLGRVTAEPVFAQISSPFFHSAAMDGYAVRFSDTFGASEREPISLEIVSQAVYVDTGDPLPEGFNAVVMIEDVNISKDTAHIEIIAPVTPWQNVRVIGEDIVATELILPEKHKIRSLDIAAILAGGQTEIQVHRKPKVIIIPTGSELVEPGERLRRGNIIDFNSWMLSGLITEWGGVPIRFKIVRDDKEEIKKALLDAHKAGDIIVINAGASAGAEDYTAQAIREVGEVVLHGVSIKPGKPLILGWLNKKPVLGIPGYPVSAYITFDLFVREMIYRIQSQESPGRETLTATLSRQVASTLGQEEFLRVKVGKVGKRFVATPVSRGAGMLMSLVQSDGMIRIPAMSEGIGAGSQIQVELFREQRDIEKTIVCVGSHDNTLDLLANMVKKRYPRLFLSSAHVGSMGGLRSLKRGDAHIAGMHLLDEKTGEYNVPFIKQILGKKKTVLINLVHRQQGLLVLKGNPKNIKGFHDLVRKDILFVNRQLGAGTRLLTDKCLRDLNISASQVRGYEREEFTHMGLASAIISGIADTGLGILAAAHALGLDFIPVTKERYDIAIPKEFIQTEMIQCLLEIIRKDTEFRNAVMSLGGYDISDMGKIVFES
jgi:putative molybdopterin biosynthesis protein